MAVLVEGISVVVRHDAIASRCPGSWNGFVTAVPNKTLCADQHLARVEFMAPDDVKAYVARLDEFGIRHRVASRPGDVIVIDQVAGPTSKCDWVETGTIKLQGGEIYVARLAGDQTNMVATPTGWTYAGSLSNKFAFVRGGAANTTMTYLRHENGLDVFLDLSTGGEMYIGRTPKE